MKIALCLSGQPRGIPQTCDFILQNLIRPNNITDIFIHTWYDKSIDLKPFDSAQPNKSSRVGCWIPNTDGILKEKLNPTTMLIEAPRSFEELNHLRNVESAVQTRLASMFYSAHKANQLKQEQEEANGFKYDVVIKTRIDLMYYRPVILSEIVDNDLSTSVYAPAIHQYMRQGDSYPIKSGGHYSSLSDTFLIASSENMDKITSVFPNFEQIHEEIWPHVYGEAYLGYIVRGIHKLPIVTKNIEYILYKS